MQLHEYQAKGLLAQRGVPVPAGRLASTPAEASQAFEDLGGAAAVVKAQIHAGARARAGGIVPVRSAAEAHQAAQRLLGRPLVTAQTGPAGLVVRRVWLEPAVEVRREFYAGVVLDRDLECPVLAVTAEGGTSIEELMRHRPAALRRIPLDPLAGCLPFQARWAADFLAGSDPLARGLAEVLQALAGAFYDHRAALVEINPLAETGEGRLLALDAKMDLEDDALYLDESLRALYEPDDPDSLEARARAAGLSYVPLAGTIGCVVNGAGLAMATLDLIHHYGGEPANFLDIGGGASPDRMRAAFDLLQADPRVKVILVNIFGGIVRCDQVAQAVIEAARAARQPRPLVVRLEGTQVTEARQLLAASGLAFDLAADMDQAARLVVEKSRS